MTTNVKRITLPARRPGAKPAAPADKDNGKAPRTAPTDPIAKLRAAQEWAAGSVVGRGDLLDDVLLAIVARMNCLFLGPPGTAKTMGVERIAQAFADQPGDVFSILLTKFTKPFEVFGPTDLGALERGEVKVNTAGFLPTARVGILDEVFKGNSAILNALLRIANERRFQNGPAWEDTPTRMLVGMSNEFPEEPALLAAFFDRFPLKRMVGYLGDDSFGEMLRAADGGGRPAGPCPVRLTEADFGEIDRRVAACEVPDDVLRAVAEIRRTLAQRSVVISDRRYVQAVRLMRAHAVLDGRAKVTRADLPVLESVAWNTPQDRGVIAEILPNYQNPIERTIRDIVDEVCAERKKLLDACNADGADKARPSPDLTQAAQAGGVAYSRMKMIGAQLDMIEEQADTEDAAELLGQARGFITEVSDAVRAITTGRVASLDDLIATERREI